VAAEGGEKREKEQRRPVWQQGSIRMGKEVSAVGKGGLAFNGAEFTSMEEKREKKPDGQLFYRV